MAEIEGVPTPPPDDSSTSKSGPSTPSKAHLPTAEMLHSWLPLYLKKTDNTIAHLRRILSHPSTTDSLLCTLQYSTLATSALLSTLSLRRLHAQITRLLSFSSALAALPPHTTLLLTTTPSAIAPPPLLRLSHSLKALSALLSDARTFARLWGLLSLYEWARALAARPPADRVLRRIAWAQVAIGVVYQVLENGAYLAGKGVLRGRAWDRGAARAWLWSARCWMAHVGLELLRLGYVRWRRERRRERERVRAGWEGMVAVEEEEEEEKEMLGSEEVDEGAWTRDLVSNAAYAPLTVHWSLEKGFAGDFWIGILGTVAGGVRFAEVWKNTA